MAELRDVEYQSRIWLWTYVGPWKYSNIRRHFYEYISMDHFKLASLWDWTIIIIYVKFETNLALSRNLNDPKILSLSFYLKHPTNSFNLILK